MIDEKSDQFIRYFEDVREDPKYREYITLGKDDSISGGKPTLKQSKYRNPFKLKKQSSYCEKMSRYDLNEFFSIDRLIECYNDLQEKNIGNICITGSLALYLQGKISRTEFKDLDIIVTGEYSLDDDINELVKREYPPDPNGTTVKSVEYNGVPIDFFSGRTDIDRICVKFNGKSYLCQDYKQIIKAKINMILPKIKDLDELMGVSFDIMYK